jgi:hypothetical protein
MIGVVSKKNVPGFECIETHNIDKTLHCAFDRTNLRWAKLSLSDQATRSIKDHAGEVQRFIKHWGICGSDHCQAHLSTGSGKIVINNRQSGLIYGGHALYYSVKFMKKAWRLLLGS